MFTSTGRYVFLDCRTMDFVIAKNIMASFVEIDYYYGIIQSLVGCLQTDKFDTMSNKLERQ